MEQYLEAIAHLLTKDKVCSISDIAEVAHVSRPAASRAIRDLAEKNLVVHRSYSYVDLTPQGKALANQLTVRHEGLMNFLHKVLHFEEHQADAEACRLEHHVDDETVKRLVQLTEFITESNDTAQTWSKRLG